jgi:uncharacterized metal-binding protein YceD (DUF177 family)
VTPWRAMAKRPPKEPDLLDLPPEWSHVVHAESVTSQHPVEVVLTADADARAAVARRLGLLSLPALSAELILTRDGAAVRVGGHFSARVVQACVVSLEPVETALRDAVEGWFADPSAAIPLARARRDRVAERSGREYRMLEEADDPEPLGPGGTIDLGELVTQHLALALPTHPRAAGAGEGGEDAPDIPTVPNPFVALAAWREGEGA